MPKITGPDVLRILGADSPAGPRHAAILLTAAGDLLSDPDASDLAPHIAAVLTKPFELDQLEPTLATFAAPIYASDSCQCRM